MKTIKLILLRIIISIPRFDDDEYIDEDNGENYDEYDWDEDKV